VIFHEIAVRPNPDGHARTTLVNACLAERRSSWRRVLLRLDKEPTAPSTDLDAILDLREAPATLPPRQRATVVLRYGCGLGVEQTAEALGCWTGTVKSQTARGLDALRRARELRHRQDEQGPAAIAALGGLRGLLTHVRTYGLDPAHRTTHVLP
jgi:DNA-directed RNA polymerase specialized sigma24 family protein